MRKHFSCLLRSQLIAGESCLSGVIFPHMNTFSCPSKNTIFPVWSLGIPEIQGNVSIWKDKDYYLSCQGFSSQQENLFYMNKNLGQYKAQRAVCWELEIKARISLWSFATESPIVGGCRLYASRSSKSAVELKHQPRPKGAIIRSGGGGSQHMANEDQARLTWRRCRAPREGRNNVKH